ncbi:NUDIX domain-containing protein [Pedobacter sp. Leaf194]|uniref:NUDIX hydrolase n=1 Tax=Pedobacter sp. Leaf194 TaxID=1736297 RepID=UPI00070286E1|nr:NUDIX domain-containing protein [Pedobacter sp. Leaf194]KQS35743.1 DNA mismatch repair protein MutT [Pedobacter sp. Leaf194]RZL29376.1 MAG: NUDIX domain-containing protein [Pedobacter sp.]
MAKYINENPVLVAVDCIIFGYDGEHLKLLVIKRAIEPVKDKWSLMGGFIGKDEDLDGAAKRILLELTGLHDVYLEQFHAYGSPDRDPIERTISVVYFALIDINKYSKQINDQYHAEWFKLKEVPELIFDHNIMVKAAMDKIRYQAALHPILFELLPKKFTIPQLQNLYEQVYDSPIDNRNFIRKITASGLLIKQTEKDKSSSRRGAFYFKLDKQKHKAQFQSFLSFISKPKL